MKTVKISDVTLRQYSLNKDSELSFKEKLEIIKSLDKLNIDTIELPAINDEKADVLMNKTAAFSVKCALSASVGYTKESIELAWSSIREAKQPALSVALPVSPVQMEFICHKKAPKMIEMIKEMVSSCRFHFENVEFCAQDATRAEASFLYEAIGAAIDCGANRITVCDSAGVMTPDEFHSFISSIFENVPKIEEVELFCEISDEIGMATACAAAAIDAGAAGIKTTVNENGIPTLEAMVHYIERKGNDKGICCRTKVTELIRNAKQMRFMLQTKRGNTSPFDNGVSDASANICLDANDDISEVIKVIHQLGYDLSDEDNAKVYESFKHVALKKHFVGTKELEAIIASCALQVPATYRTISYVINCGNIITATANIVLEKNGKQLSGVSVGDGPIDAAFLAIEQIIGHHYELDDFQIQAVTEGREAMGSALVKLRSGGKLYSGTGISTDVVGASIRAYVNALNKITFDEEA